MVSWFQEVLQLIFPHLSDDLNWIASRLLETLNAALPTFQLHVYLFVSHSQDLKLESLYTPHSQTVSELLSHTFVKLEMRKPDVKDLLHNEIMCCVGPTLIAGTQSQSWLQFFTLINCYQLVSGPPPLANDVRHTLGPSSLQDGSALNGTNEIYLHVEAYRISVSFRIRVII